MTKRSRSSSAEASKSHDIPSAYFDFSIWNDFPARFDERAYLAFNKYVLGERSLSQFTHSLRRPVRNWINDPSRGATARADLWYHPDLHVEPAWDSQRRGYFNWNADKKRRLVENLIKALPPARALQSSINYQNVCCDFEQLNIDWEYVEQVEHSLKSLREVTDHLVLVQLPENPDFVRNPESSGRMKEVMQRLQNASDAQLWTEQELGSFNMFDFIDVIHFSSGGVFKFSDLLAKQVPADWLGSN